ncbi:MAG: hypothetical protein JWM27_3700 [Gemmatimonadetes bacterium]|nr:hypothetical protein [Gemmatimonadota bacterium]
MIRRHLAFRRKLATLDELAKEIHISRSAVDKTLKEPINPDKNLQKLTEWFVRDRRALYGPLQGADRVIQLLDTLDVLLPQERAEAAKELADAYQTILGKRKAPIPPWVDMLRQTRPEDLTGEAPGDPPKRKKGRRKKEGE